MTDFKLPELGENIAAGDVVRVLVKPGDTIAKDQPVLELETDKATIEVPSSVAGVVKDVQVKAGQKIKVGTTILTVDGDGGAAAKPAAAKDDGSAEADQAEKPKAQPSGAPEEGGLSQRASADAGSSSGGGAAARADREGDKDGKADQPEAQRAAGSDDDAEEEAPAF